MSTLNPPKRISKRHELRQDTVVTFYARVWEYVDKNRSVAYLFGAAVVAVVLGIVGYIFWQAQQAVTAQEALGSIISVYENADYRAALDGTETALGLIAIAEQYGGTDAGNLARFYAADAHFRLKEYDQALRYFQAYDKGDNLVGASAYAGEAAVYESQGDYERAGDLYQRAASTFESDIISPDYLLNAARAYEKAGAYGEARAAYEMIREQYAGAPVAANIDVYLARLDAKAGQ